MSESILATPVGSVRNARDSRPDLRSPRFGYLAGGGPVFEYDGRRDPHHNDGVIYPEARGTGFTCIERGKLVPVYGFYVTERNMTPNAFDEGSPTHVEEERIAAEVAELLSAEYGLQGFVVFEQLTGNEQLAIKLFQIVHPRIFKVKDGFSFYKSSEPFNLLRQANLSQSETAIGEAAIAELRVAYTRAFEYMRGWLNDSFSEIERSRAQGRGKMQLDRRDEYFITETGITPPAFKPVELATAQSKQIAESMTESMKDVVREMAAAINSGKSQDSDVATLKSELAELKALIKGQAEVKTEAKTKAK